MKQANQQHCHSNHFVTFLQKLLDDIRNGDIQIPKFQRPPVQSREDRLELLRNIRDGIPMGAITTWTSEQKLECYRNPVSSGEFPDRDSRQYLLNGAQNLFILLGASFPESNVNNEIDEFQDGNIVPSTQNLGVHFDLDLDDFVHSDELQPNQEGRALPLGCLFDSIRMMKFQRQLQQFDESDTRIEQCDRLGHAFRNYMIPMIHIVTENVAIATRTLEMVNSQDRATSEEQIVRALNWKQDSDHPEPF